MAVLKIVDIWPDSLIFLSSTIIQNSFGGMKECEND